MRTKVVKRFGDKGNIRFHEYAGPRPPVAHDSHPLGTLASIKQQIFPHQDRAGVWNRVPLHQVTRHFICATVDKTVVPTMSIQLSSPPTPGPRNAIVLVDAEGLAVGKA